MRKTLTTFALLALLSAGCSNDRPEIGKTPDLERADGMRKLLFTEAAAEAEVADVPSDLKPEGFETLSGTFMLAGNPPTSGMLKIDKDLSVCLPGGGSLADNTIEVNPANKGIKNVLIFADNVPADWVHESAKANETETVFDQKACLFLDHVFAVQTNQKLMIKNSDPIGHNTKFEPRSNSALNVTLAGGDVFPYTPQKAEAQPFAVSCTVHGWMKAYMIFRDNGYFAVTDADGKFEIPNVPTGVPLQLKIWHEMGTSLKSITVGSEKVALKRGALERTLKPGEAAALEFTIDATELK